MILFWIFYRKVSLMYHRSIMPFGIPYFPPRQGEDIPTLGGSVPHGVGGNPRSIFYELQVYVLRIASLCFIHEMPVVLVIVYGFVLANIPNNKNTGNTVG